MQLADFDFHLPEERIAQEALADRAAARMLVVHRQEGRWEDRGYDCSGTVSFVLHAADLLSVTLDSSGLTGWGSAGTGRWISVYGNAGHAYMVIAGLRFDTSGAGESGPRWRPEPRSSRGFLVRHPAGL